MTDIKLNNSTLATASGSTISWGSGVPAGTMTYIKNVTFSGVGNISDQPNWYPTNMDNDSAKTLYSNLSATEHASYSKIRIEFSFDMRINKASYAFIGLRLVRWQGNADAAPTTSHGGETSLYWAIGGGVTDVENYQPFAGAVIDDISGLSGTIHYALQYRNAQGIAITAGNMYAGALTTSRHQMILTGIV